MTTLTVAEVSAAIAADASLKTTSTLGGANGAIAVGTTKFGHVFVGAAAGPGSQASAGTSLTSNFAAARAYAIARWATIDKVPEGLTLDLTSEMTQEDYDKAPVPDVTDADMALINGVASSQSTIGGAVANYTTDFGTTSAAIIDSSGTNSYHPTDAAETQAKNLAIGYEAYARRIYRVAAFAKLNPDVGLPS
jgi:hypothetical protein